MAPTKIHPDSSAEDLIAHCWGPDAEFIENTERYANHVVKIGDSAVMKFGRLVTKFEFENMKIAKTLVDPNIVYIPEVYRFLSDSDGDAYGRDRGYILMEYVHGRRIDPLDDPERIERIAKIVAHFASIRGEQLGALGGGPSRGIIFPDNYGDPVFDDVQAMEDFYNKRLFPRNGVKLDLNLKGVELVLCHLDIAPRNIIWRDDDSICLIDWVSAGFYPRSFEFATRRYLLGSEGDFDQMLLDAIKPPLSEEERVQSLAVVIARGNAERYTFRKPAPRPPRSRRSGYTPDKAYIPSSHAHNMPPLPPLPPPAPIPTKPAFDPSGPPPPDLVFVTHEDYNGLVYTPWGWIAHPDAKPRKGGRFYKK
ncbi:hypothetical protein FQN54_009943 [Arachnomyces sp. PD_36]|nr:hypothetical protein FQN54_009943 [Arachnomyces sp. PD_36]